MKVTTVMFNVTKKLIFSILIVAFSVSRVHAESAMNLSPEIMNYGMIPLVFLVMYLLLIRPQNAKAKRHQQMLTALRRGDQVLTAGGIIGTVQKIESDQEIQVDIADGVRVRIAKGTIAQVLAKTEPLKTSNLDTSVDFPRTQDQIENMSGDKAIIKTTSKNVMPSQSRKRTTKTK